MKYFFNKHYKKGFEKYILKLAIIQQLPHNFTVLQRAHYVGASLFTHYYIQSLFMLSFNVIVTRRAVQSTSVQTFYRTRHV